MASPAALSNHGPKDATPPPSKDGNGAIPSGFILKLYQMVNGAPDEVISWTPDGDAFKIGSDLNRLESETLPHYFRHSRFQSLVRQLNFYNFRKVNRERTFWIYKHRLFHRDRPQDLHLLRRRTCPGVDGRKNRFSSGASARKSSSDNSSSMKSTSALDCLEGREALVSTNYNAHSRDQSSNEDSSLGDSSDDEDLPSNSRFLRKKRNSTSFGNAGEPVTKRSRRMSQPDIHAKRLSSNEEKKEDESVVVDLSLVGSGSSGNFSGHENVLHRDGRASKGDDVDDTSLSDKDERSEMIEQSLVVSQVAMKLEEYARKAKRGLSRTRRGALNGVVTPPHHGQLSAVLTYDDEYEEENESLANGRKTFSGDGSRRRSDASNAVVTDGDDSMTSEDERSPSRLKKHANCVSETHTPVHQSSKKSLFTRPVTDIEIVNAVTRRLLSSGMTYSGGSMVVSSVVASFCMRTPPSSSDDLCSQILGLVSSYECLALEFQQYRAALHPLQCSNDLLPGCTFTAGFRKNQAVSWQQIWASAASRSLAICDFKTFAVNCINWVLDQTSEKNSNVSLSDVERSALQHTAHVWLASARASV